MTWRVPPPMLITDKVERHTLTSIDCSACADKGETEIMLVPNSEKQYKNFTVGLCEHSDIGNKYFEAYYRENTDESQTYTENNVWLTKEEAYKAVESVVDHFQLSE